MLRILAALFIIAIAGVVQAAQLNGVRLWRAPDNTRIVFDLSAPAQHKLFTLQGPERVVIDIDDVELASTLEELSLADTPIAAVRYGKRDATGLRVVLDLKAAATPRSFSLPEHGDKPNRLVVDLYDSASEANQTAVAKKEVAQQVGEMRDIVVVIDAGHGGEDPGALGPQKIREKDVVLEISKQLAKLVNDEPGYKALLVREGDYYLPLQTRRDKARQLRADLFISVHADAFKNPQAHGASVFALSRRGATSETARFLASKENEADLIGGVGGVSLSDKDELLAGVLVDLSMTATLTNSLDVGQRVLREMGKITKLHKMQVEQAGFAVLKSPDVPSILVETGFISNPEEAKKLNTASHRNQLAKAVFAGVKEYFNDAPPAGSYIAWKQHNAGEREYVIADGDTLSDIAKRYNISVRQLVEYNQLSGSIIRAGQRLIIPAS